MKQPILIKLIISYILFGFAGFSLITTISFHMTYNYLEGKTKDALYNQAYSISGYYNSYGFDSIEDYATISNELSEIIKVTSFTLWVATPDGHLVFDSENANTYISDFDIDRFNGNAVSRHVFDEYFGETTLSSICSITNEATTEGYVIITVPTKYVTSYANDITYLYLLTAFFLLLLSLLPLIVVIVFVYKPICKINAAAKEFAKGNFKNNTIEITSHDEMGELASSLNYMAIQLADSEEYQTKFISNISHDFRSPLTSIRGYLEAILDGTIPKENQEKYLKIVLNEAQRLTKLSSGLIDLNTWGQKGNGIIRTTFDINPVIYEVLESFEGQCDAKNISFDVTLDSKRYPVNADKDKIKQVLYNLVDNAIKFSEKNSNIFVNVASKGNKVFVTIKDSGIGISRQDLPKIWDRFYKIDKSRGKNKNSSGIGLSIVKEIIQAHGENIDVISTPNVGTEFIFTLEKAEKNGK